LPSKRPLHVEDSAPDQFRDLRNDRVAQRNQSLTTVHLAGRPINHSTHVGFNCPPTTSGSCGVCPFSERPWPDRQSLAAGEGKRTAVAKLSGFRVANRLALIPLLSPSSAVGVGHDPEAVPLVRGANGGSWYAMPLRIIPERGQVSENVAKPSTKQRCDVLHDDVAGTKFANETGIFRP